MKVIHISTSISETSANTRLHKALLAKGIDSKILTISHSGDIPEVYDLEKSFGTKLSVTLQAKLSERRRKKIDIYPGVPFSLGDIGYNLKKNPLIQEADVIHLHWICNILSIQNIMELIKLNKRIVWTCHDSWAFTGGCHVRYGCMNFTKECGMCPELCSSKEKDLSKIVLQKKKEAWDRNNIAFIAPSNWMKENILISYLFGNNDVVVIPNTLNTKVYQKKECSKEKSKKSILFGAADAKVQYKGFDFLIKMLKELLKINPFAEREYCLQFVGTNRIENTLLERFECKFWGFVSEQREMARIYSSADVFVCPSLDDNLPGMVMESLACETPVVAFSTGGIPDMVEHKRNGYLAEYKNAEDLAKGLIWVIEHNREGKVGVEAREKVLENYSPEIVAEKHIELYKTLLNQIN